MSSPYTVTATIFDPSATGVVGNAYLRFSLRNFDGSVPIVSSTGVFVETQLDAFPGAGGAISQSIVGNNNITPANTYWQIQYWNNGRITSSGNYFIDGNTNLNTASTISPSPIPGPPNTIVFENNGAMNSSQTKLNLESTDASVVITDEGSGTINLQAVTQNPLTFINRISFVAEGLAKNASATSSGCNMGMCCAFDNEALINYPTGYAASSVQPSYVQIESNSTTTSGGFTDQQLNITTSLLQDWQMKIEIAGIAPQRYWMGVSDKLQSGVESVFNSDTPDANFIGFRYDSAVDTHYQAICQTDDTHQTAVDTGITPSAVHLLEFQPNSNDNAINFYIQGSLVATISTNLPSASTALATLAVCDDQSTGTSKLNFYWTTALLDS